MEIVGKEYTGLAFKQLFVERFPQRAMKLYRLTNDREIHRGFQYITGLNVDTNKFNPHGRCLGGGLYFFDCVNIFWHVKFSQDSVWIREVTIPDDARVYVEPDGEKYKADKFILSERKRFVPNEYITEEMCTFAVQNDGKALRCVPGNLRTEEMCTSAVLNDDRALEFVPKNLLTEEICTIAVRNNGRAICYVSKNLRTEEMCTIAVQNDGDALYYVPENLRTKEMCTIAVQNDGWALRWVPEYLQTKEMCTSAVLNDDRALEFVPKNLFDRRDVYDLHSE